MRLSFALSLSKQKFPLGTPAPTTILLTLLDGGKEVFRQAFPASSTSLDTDADGVPAGDYVAIVQAYAAETMIGDQDSKSVTLPQQTVEHDIPRINAISVN